MNQKALPVRVCDFLSVIFLQLRDVLSVSFPFVLEIDLVISVSLPMQHRILIVGDFNPGQMLPENVTKIDL